MRILIQEMKTIIRTVTEDKQLSKENSNTKDSPDQETQTNPLKWPLWHDHHRHHSMGKL